MAEKLTWKPRQAGSVYCSPACGRGCTVEEWNQAKMRAHAIVEGLSVDKGWKPEVWENLGWHAQAVHGDIRVMNSGPKYHAFCKNHKHESRLL